MKFIRNRVLFFANLMLLTSIVNAEPVNITFNNSLPVSVSDPAVNYGCHTSSFSYNFDVTMFGYNNPISSCTSANLFPISGFLTTGQYGPGGASSMIMTAPVGVTFDMKSFILQNYSSTSYLMVTGFDDLGNAVMTMTLKGFAGSHLYSLPGFIGLSSISIRNQKARFNITAINLVDTTVAPPLL
jgi:hypothetical protein